MTTNNVKVLSDNTADCGLQVRIATQEWEKQEIYRLRYKVYVQEMSRPLGSPANENNQLSDALDNRSILLYAQAGGNIIGTMRLTIAAVEDYSADIVEIFHMHKFKAFYTDLTNPLFSLGTKLAVEPSYRNSPVLFLLISEAYRILRKQAVQFFFGGCNPNMIPLYERIGFRRFTKNFTDPGYGLLVPLVALPEDLQHFQAVRSPLYRHARKYASDVTMTHYFLQAFPEALQCLNTQLVTQEILWEYAQCQLSASPFAIPPFTGLDRKSIMDLLPAGAIFACSPDDCILSPDNLCNDLYILLSGVMKASTPTRSRTLRSGDHFGGFILPAHSIQKESVSALTESEVFVLPHQAFARYQHLHQEAANILLNNLTSTPEFAYACATLTNQGGQQDE